MSPDQRISLNEQRAGVLFFFFHPANGSFGSKKTRCGIDVQLFGILIVRTFFGEMERWLYFFSLFFQEYRRRRFFMIFGEYWSSTAINFTILSIRRYGYFIDTGTLYRFHPLFYFICDAATSRMI